MVILAAVFKTALFHLVIEIKPFQVDLCSTSLTNNLIPEYQLYYVTSSINDKSMATTECGLVAISFLRKEVH